MARSRGKKKSTPGWVWLLTGLGIGLLVALVIYVREDLPEMNMSFLKKSPPAKTTDTRAVRKHTSKAIPPPDKTPYSFYDLLPEMEVAIPEENIGKKNKSGVRELSKPGIYIMQVGSFSQYKDADRLKASLALLGLEASIQTVTIDSKTTRHRVRLGPYSDLDKINAVRKRLKQNNIDSILLKIKT